MVQFVKLHHDLSMAEIPFLPGLALDFPDGHRFAQLSRSRFFFLFAVGDASADPVA